MKTREQVHDGEEFRFILHLGKDIIDPGHRVSNGLGNLVEFMVVNDSLGGKVLSIFLQDQHEGESPGAGGLVDDSILFHDLEFFLDLINVLVGNPVQTFLLGDGISSVNVMIVLGLKALHILEVGGKDVFELLDKVLDCTLLEEVQSFSSLV